MKEPLPVVSTQKNPLAIQTAAPCSRTRTINRKRAVEESEARSNGNAPTSARTAEFAADPKGDVVHLPSKKRFKLGQSFVEYSITNEVRNSSTIFPCARCAPCTLLAEGTRLA
eukprot:SAG31_NODE_4431_length_3236_cov_2.397832_5_plen_113_part_00